MRWFIRCLAVAFLIGLTGCCAHQNTEDVRRYHERMLRHEMRISRFIEQMNEAIQVMKGTPAEIAMKQKNLELQQENIELLRKIMYLLEERVPGRSLSENTRPPSSRR